MTEEQIKQHLEKVIKHANELAVSSCKQQWEDYKNFIVENGGCPIPTELESNIQAVFNYAYATGIAQGIEDTIVRYNMMFNTGKGGEA